ncbi:MAG: hypothetical protein HPY74_00820 [Firmicutes bacterium]|nr:hypothetical protein [Bacillota bacterium]
MKKKILTTEDKLKKYKKRFFILLVIFILFIGFISIYIYLNYDYLVFKHFITQHYIYTDTLDKLYNDELKRDVRGRYFNYFDDVVISVVTKRIQEIGNDRYTYLYTPEHYKKYKEEEKEEALQSQLKVLDNHTVYLHITNFSIHTRKFIEDNIEEIKKYPNLIIDLRSNYGGDTFAMYAMADLFLPKGSVIATDRMRLFSKTVKAKKGKILSNNKIVILQDKNTASASENFIAALHDNLDNVILIGDKTFGKGIGQFTMPLKKGFAVKATTMLWYTPNGTNIQGQGISPDIYYTNEDIIDFAVKKFDQWD